MRGSIHDAAGSSSQHRLSPPPSSRCDAAVPAIFLSHSGRQKPFVEKLYDALRRANHTAFFDQHTLLKGAAFPREIQRAARGCELGVVVLSEDFIISKWPMLELEILVGQRGPNAMVLPLFYKLHPVDLKSPENLLRWRAVWEYKTGTPDAFVKWGKALRALSAFCGEIFVEGTSEAAYINRVVRSICEMVPSPLANDLFPIKGLHRLAKEVAGMFLSLDEPRRTKAIIEIFFISIIFIFSIVSQLACFMAGSSSQHRLSPPPSSLCDAAVPAIFLSYSEKQKPFVENLYDALRRANHTAFFHPHTLLKGVDVRRQIQRAARGCELGVVVLSHDFITSKWNMLELEIFVGQRDSKAMVLPLFYKLHPVHLKSPMNLSMWRAAWEGMTGTSDAAVCKWGEALRALSAFNGEIFVPGTSEAAYINRVVHSICKVVPSDKRGLI